MSDTTKAVTTPVRASQAHEKENMVYQFTINRLPSKYLSKNSGRRWLPQMIDAKFKEDIKTTIAFFLEKYTRPSEPLQQATVTVKLYFRYRRHRDHTNYAGMLGGFMDGLVHAGIIADDSVDVIGHPDIQFIVDREKGYSTEFIIAPA